MLSEDDLEMIRRGMRKEIGAWFQVGVCLIVAAGSMWGIFHYYTQNLWLAIFFGIVFIVSLTVIGKGELKDF